MNGTPSANGPLNTATWKSLHDRAREIRSREDFVDFTRALIANLRDHPEEWENDNLGNYLEALAAWVEDMDGYYQNRNEPVPQQPTWKTLGEILSAAKVYE